MASDTKHTGSNNHMRYIIILNPQTRQYELQDTEGCVPTISLSRPEPLMIMRDQRNARAEKAAAAETAKQRARREAYEAGYSRYR